VNFFPDSLSLAISYFFIFAIAIAITPYTGNLLYTRESRCTVGSILRRVGIYIYVRLSQDN